MSIILEPFNASISSAANFQSQLATLKYAGTHEGSVIMLRSFIHAGSSKGVGFDPVFPNADTNAGWKFLEQLIDEHGIIGDFHNHANPDDKAFTAVDLQTIRGLARTYGKKYLYHGVYVDGYTHWVCANMIGGQVLIYDFGRKQDDLGPVVVLPLPLSMKKGEGALIVPC